MSNKDSESLLAEIQEDAEKNLKEFMSQVDEAKAKVSQFTPENLGELMGMILENCQGLTDL